MDERAREIADQIMRKIHVHLRSVEIEDEAIVEIIATALAPLAAAQRELAEWKLLTESAEAKVAAAQARVAWVEEDLRRMTPHPFTEPCDVQGCCALCHQPMDFAAHHATTLRALLDRADVRIRDADRLADEVAVLVRMGKLDARSPVGDALLDYRDPPTSERADRLVTLDAEIARLVQQAAHWERRAALAARQEGT